MWNLPPPPGFQGLREDLPLTIYVRNLPHWRQDGATYFVTFRLHDSLPQVKLDELKRLRDKWLRRHPEPHSDAEREELVQETMTRVEHWLDQGMGSCVLKEPKLAAHLTQAKHHFDGDRYELDSYVVMPNHVHVIVRPLQPKNEPLEDLLHSWKLYSSRRTNAALGQSGALWLDESFDRIIRDEEHLGRALQYIGKNPEKAGLAKGACPLWIRPQWEELGWKFDDQAQLLPVGRVS